MGHPLEKERVIKTAEPPSTKDQFLRLVDEVQIEPIFIEIPGGDTTVLLSQKEYRRIRKESLEDFHSLCARMSAYAQAQGLTEEILANILADESD